MITDDLLPDIIAVANRAPSAHNTQPWRLVRCKDAIRLLFDPARQLAASDPSGRDLWLSLGGFAEAFLIAAANRGQRVGFVTDVDVTSHAIGWFVVASLAYRTQFKDTDLLARQTSRRCYAAHLLDGDEVLALSSLLENGWRIVALNSQTLASEAAIADRYIFNKRAATEELHRWLRIGSDFEPSGDGLSPQCLEMGAVEARVFRALLGRPLFPATSILGLGRLVGRRSKILLRQPHSVLILVGRAVDAAHVVDGGRGLLRIWLQLTRMGHYAQPLSQLIDCPWTRLRLADMARCAPGENPFTVLRVGRSPQPPRSRRRAPDEVW